MDILIAGGAGFIGSHLCEFLLDKGHNIICVDNLSTGNINNLDNISNEILFINQDICQTLNYEGNVDYILNFASPASPKDYLAMPIETLMVGAIGTQNLLNLARTKNAKILVASTSEVYGDPLISPQSEDYWGNVNSIGLRSVYDEGKRYMESIVMAYHRTYNIDTKIIRIFNTYGTRMKLDDGRALPNFIQQIKYGKDITIYGDGSQTRSFCYVSDLIEGIYAVMLSDYNLPINLGNPEEITLLEFAQELLKLSGRNNKIVYEPLPQDDPKQRKPDITLAKSLLSWCPKVSRTEGLNKCIDYYLKYQNEY